MKRVRAPLPIPTSTRSTKRRAVGEAGLSLHQLRQAVRVANLPDEEFERLIESDDPPTVERLATLGRRRRQGAVRRPRATPCPQCGGTGRVPVTELLE